MIRFFTFNQKNMQSYIGYTSVPIFRKDGWNRWSHLATDQEHVYNIEWHIYGLRWYSPFVLLLGLGLIQQAVPSRLSLPLRLMHNGSTDRSSVKYDGHSASSFYHISIRLQFWSQEPRKWHFGALSTPFNSTNHTNSSLYFTQMSSVSFIFCLHIKHI